MVSIRFDYAMQKGRWDVDLWLLKARTAFLCRIAYEWHVLATYFYRHNQVYSKNDLKSI